MTKTMRDAARKAAELQWVAEQYRQHGERSGHLRERAERLANRLEELAASTLCRGFHRGDAMPTDA